MVTGWNRIAVQFEDKTINMSKVIIREAFLGNGFVSSAEVCASGCYRRFISSAI